MRVKILHVETGRHLYGGAQQVAYLLDGLAERGVDNVLVCAPGAAIGVHFSAAGARTRVRVVETACSGDLDFSFVWRLRRIIAAERPHLVHLHSRRGADVLGGLAARWAGVPVILSRRVDNPEHPLWARCKYARYVKVICISQGIAEVLVAEGVSRDRIAIVRSAVDAAPWTQPATRAEFCAEFQVNPDRLLVGVAAQLIERKGHSVLLQALRDLSEHTQLAVVFFGQGPRRAALEQEVRSLGLQHCVHFAGFRRDLPRWMGCLDLLVHPAYSEGLGVSLLQASAAGVPIIASRTGGIPEAVGDNDNGLLVTPGDAEALALALQRLIADAGLRSRLGAGGIARIARAFSIPAMVEGNLQIYQQLIGNA